MRHAPKIRNKIGLETGTKAQWLTTEDSKNIVTLTPLRTATGTGGKESGGLLSTRRYECRPLACTILGSAKGHGYFIVAGSAFADIEH